MSPNRIAISAAAGLTLTAVAACTTLPVTTDSNPGMNAAVCHTYAFAQEHVGAPGQPMGAYANPLNGDRLRAAIEANLASRGLQRVDDRATADCVVGYSIGSRLVADAYPGFEFGYGYRFGRYGIGGFGYDYPYVRDEGRISVDLFDAKSRKAIWHASVNQYVVDSTGAYAEARINAAATAIFSKFPIGAPLPAAPRGT